jgi:signal transduction histidine kinase
MSHEIRTPLNAILGFGNRLMQDCELSPVQMRAVRAINQSGSHLLSLVNDILDYAKIRSGRTTLEIVEYSLSELSSEMASIHQSRAEAKGLRFRCFYGKGVPDRVRGDVVKMRQVIINLLSNAIKFTSSGCVVFRIEMEPEFLPNNPAISIIVSDSGPGIDPGELPHLFDDFYQGSLGRNVGGTGLGLSIVKNFLESMGGRIDVESTPGTGSSFKATLSLDVVEEVSPVKSSKPELEQRSPGLEPNIEVCVTRFMQLPEPVRQSMRSALDAGNMRVMRNLLREIPLSEVRLVQSLSAMIDRYDYNSLRRVIYPASEN